MPPSVKKSVAIITHFHQSQNYGGVLQACALRKVTADMGYTAGQLRYNTAVTDTTHAPLSARICRKITHVFTEAGKKESAALSLRYLIHICIVCAGFPFRATARKLFINKHRDLRRKNFDTFNEKYVPSSKEYTNETIREAADAYDIFITGSDQVWNPLWFHEPYYLSFVPENKPKIAYAASTALSSLTEEQYNKMQPLITRINHISVREQNAIDLLKDMTPQKIEWVLDPTLLLTAEQWNDVAAQRQTREPYVLAYLLGDIKQNRRCTERFAKAKGLPLVTFPFVGSQKLWQLRFGDIHCYGGPDAFLSLIRDAEYVITDSFHAVVFSTLFKKRFVVLKRHADSEKGAMNERLYSLFQITGMERQLVSADIDELNERIENVCYDGVDERISVQREQSLAWLKKALEES